MNSLDLFPAPTRALSQAERLDWIRLIRSENVGPITFKRLLERFGSAAAALEALPELAKRGGKAAKVRIASKAQAETELAAHDKLGSRLIAWGEPDYPALVAVLEDAPPLLGVLGDVRLLNKRSIAMVGARNASLNGRRLAEKLAGQLGHAGLVVVSGLARGIDTSAHIGALATGTVAVQAGGLDVVYPPENEDLHAHIREQGCLVAEEPPGVGPQARHFPRRNRLVSGLTLGTLVVEAALRSGSLITARMAADQGREVFAVPGSPLDPRAEGTNNLLRDGAVLTTCAEDVLNALPDLRHGVPFAEPLTGSGFLGQPLASPGEADLSAARSIVQEALGPVPVGVDELIRGCHLSASVILTVLLEMELAGRLQRQPGGLVNLISL